MQNFEFLAHTLFAIYGNGLVFRGDVLNGEAKTNDIVNFEYKGKIESAKIKFIELERSIIDKTVLGKELGILLHDFSVSKFEDWDYVLPETEEEAEDCPTTEERLEMRMPIKLWCKP